MTFTLGKALLVAPPPKMESPEPYEVCLPPGAWFDYWTGERVTGETAGTEGGDGASHITQTPKLEKLPVFVRGGTILPRQPLVQSTSEAPNGPLTLDVYPGSDCAGTIYFDDGHSMAFSDGHFLRQAITCSTRADGKLAITFGPRQGDFAPWWKQIDLVVHDRSSADAVVSSTVRLSKNTTATPGLVQFEMADVPVGGQIVVGN